jgi:hypothetical protein
MTRTYAVGTANTIIRLDDYTGPWVTLAPTGDADTQWNDVMSDPTDPDKVIAVGIGLEANPYTNWSIQTSSDAGATWNIPGGDWDDDPDIQTIWYEVWYVDTNVIWVTGSEGRVAKSIDGGATFNLVDQQIASGAYFFTAGIHALDDQVAIVVGSPFGNVTQTELFVWKTIDAGTNWTLLSGASLPPPVNSGGTVNEIGNANGIWISPDQQKIVVGSGYNQYVSIDGGATWTDVLQDHFRSGIHITWFPAYDANPQYWRHVGGTARMVTQSIDNANSFTNIRSVSLGDPVVEIRGAHFYAPFDGYYTIGNEVFSTTDGGDTGTLSHTDTTLTTFNAVWTSIQLPPIPTCFELRDCAGITPSIFTETDLSAYVGQVISLKDETEHEAEGCWTVFEAGTNCPNQATVEIYRCYDDCDHCLPDPEPIREPHPRKVNPGYTTGLCDPKIVENALCSYGDMMYDQMMENRFKIEICCNRNEEKVLIEYEKIRLKLLETQDPTPDPCNPECSQYEFIVRPTDTAVFSYTDCSEEAQTLNVDAQSIDNLIFFCALDTVPPTVIVTHDDATTDEYVLYPVSGECVPL